jgi:hypothetical protein
VSATVFQECSVISLVGTTKQENTYHSFPNLYHLVAIQSTTTVLSQSVQLVSVFGCSKVKGLTFERSNVQIHRYKSGSSSTQKYLHTHITLSHLQTWWRLEQLDSTYFVLSSDLCFKWNPYLYSTVAQKS